VAANGTKIATKCGRAAKVTLNQIKSDTPGQPVPEIYRSIKGRTGSQSRLASLASFPCFIFLILGHGDHKFSSALSAAALSRQALLTLR
jgi:hypothetical protein